MSPATPPRWSDEQFEDDRKKSIHIFRENRMQEPIGQYLEAFKISQHAIDTLLETTVDLTALLDRAVDVLTDVNLLPAVRYLAGPPISTDDLRTLAFDVSLTASLLRANPDTAKQVMEVILANVDSARFPWISEDREPTEAERQGASVATAALLAQRAVMTSRAHESKDEQEQAVKDRLVMAGFTEVETRTVHNMSEAPEIGTFCGESLFGERKADIVVRLYDGRIMPTEAKVSNSATNSIKRLNNDASAKAEKWNTQFGTANVVPAAVLSGVFKLNNLRSAQSANLTIFWAHNLDAMVDFIEATK